MLMMEKTKNLEFEPCTQKMCSLLPWHTKFAVYFDCVLLEEDFYEADLFDLGFNLRKKNSSFCF
jgi:hypothetical protein